MPVLKLAHALQFPNASGGFDLPRIGSSNFRTTNNNGGANRTSGANRSTNTTSGQATKFDHTNFNEAMKHSAKTGKPMVIKVGASWCGPCKAMNATTFKDPKVKEALDKKATFVNVEVDRRGDTSAQQNAASKLARALGVRSYPTVIMATVKKDGDKLVPSFVSKGNMMNAERFTQFVNSGLNKVDQRRGN